MEVEDDRKVVEGCLEWEFVIKKKCCNVDSYYIVVMASNFTRKVTRSL